VGERKERRKKKKRENSRFGKRKRDIWRGTGGKKKKGIKQKKGLIFQLEEGEKRRPAAVRSMSEKTGKKKKARPADLLSRVTSEGGKEVKKERESRVHPGSVSGKKGKQRNRLDGFFYAGKKRRGKKRREKEALFDDEEGNVPSLTEAA